MNTIHAYISGISTGQAIGLAFLGGIVIISWIYSFIIMNRALIISALAGLILGDAEHALIFGAAAELIYLGLINAAGVVPPNTLGPGLFGVVILLTSPGMTVGTAVSLSMPFAIFAQFLVTIIFTVVSPIGKLQEKLIDKEKFVLYRITGHSTAILLFCAGFLMGAAAGFGYEAFRTAIGEIPNWLQKGLSVGGSMLPAMGFAVVLRLMLKREFMPFLLVGFTLVVIFQAVGAAKPEWGFSLVAVAIAAAAIGLVTFYSGVLSKSEGRRTQAAAPTSGEGVTDGI